jgi:hypothetical protein
MKTVSFISPNRSAVLAGLASFKFCTAEQLRRLGCGESAETARKAANWIESAYPGTIGKVSPGLRPGSGTVPNLYFLTPKGAGLAADVLGIELEEVRRPIGRVDAAFNDYAHRVATVDCLIAYRAWVGKMGYRVDFADAYFDKAGANRGGSGARMKAKTRVEFPEGYLIADGESMFDTGDRRHLFMLEMYNGHDTKRVVEQLEKHVRAIAAGSPSVKRGHGRGSFVAAVFETDAAKASSMARVAGTALFAPFRRHFLFASLDAVRDDWGACWRLFDGTATPFA